MGALEKAEHSSAPGAELLAALPRRVWPRLAPSLHYRGACATRPRYLANRRTTGGPARTARRSTARSTCSSAERPALLLLPHGSQRRPLLPNATNSCPKPPQDLRGRISRCPPAAPALGRDGKNSSRKREKGKASLGSVYCWVFPLFPQVKWCTGSARCRLGAPHRALLSPHVAATTEPVCSGCSRGFSRFLSPFYPFSRAAC